MFLEENKLFIWFKLSICGCGSSWVSAVEFVKWEEFVGNMYHMVDYLEACAEKSLLSNVIGVQHVKYRERSSLLWLGLEFHAVL